MISCDRCRAPLTHATAYQVDAENVACALCYREWEKAQAVLQIKLREFEKEQRAAFIRGWKESCVVTRD